MSETWKPVPDDYQLAIGDVVRIWSQVIGMGKVPTALEMDAIAKRVEDSDPRFRVEGYSYPDEDNWMFVKVRITEPRTPSPQLAGIGVSVAVVVGVVGGALAVYGIWALSDAEIRTTMTEAVGETVDKAAWGLAKYAAVAIVGYLAIKAIGGK
ncbi:MAG: hypothetical protein PHR30_18770 [Gallionellaceae bacterium]|nr:hypothetical protein [Gallionellaceae bacterium]